METHEARGGDLEVNGVRLHYLDWGGDGDPIVVLHATGFIGRIYRPIATALTAIGHVFSYDQRGHGDSGRSPTGEYNWATTMEDLAGFITATGLTGVRGFGHSAGATAIGALASARPDLIRSAVLVEPVIFEAPEAPEMVWRNPFIDRTRKRRRVFESVDAMFGNFDNKPPYSTWRKDILREYCEYATRAMPDGKRELKCPPEIEARYYETSTDFDGLQRILRCEVPLLIMFGARGDSPGAGLSAKVAAAPGKRRVIDFPDAGHFLPMEKPDEVARLAIEFLREN
ncbi:MAG: alpha/beta hydrolase [Candidatus Binataceae bacterium]